MRPNGTFWGDSDGTIVISRSKTPFEEKMRETFADRHTYIQTDTEIIPGKPVWHTRNFFIKKLMNILKIIVLNLKYEKICRNIRKFQRSWKNYRNIEILKNMNFMRHFLIWRYIFFCKRSFILKNFISLIECFTWAHQRLIS